LILVLDVKVVVKVVALVLAFIMQPNLRLGTRLKNSRLPLFYPVVMGLAIIDALFLGRLRESNYPGVLATGLLFWTFCLLAAHQLKLYVERESTERLHRTVLVFFIINAALSFCELFRIIIETGAINPYRYQGLYQKYFINTGDFIKGVTWDTSTTNAAINAFGIVYFFYRKNFAMVFVCLCTLLLTGSNLIIIATVLTLLGMAITVASRPERSIVAVCVGISVIFFAKISPQNNAYITDTFNRLLFHKLPQPALVEKPRLWMLLPDDSLSPEEQKKKVAQHHLDSLSFLEAGSRLVAVAAGLSPRPAVPEDSIHTAPFQHKDDTMAATRELLRFLALHAGQLPHGFAVGGLPGKITAAEQTVRFLSAHPLRILTGNGAGTFSSKLAFRATALKIAGGYPARISYVSPDFLGNHLALYLFYFARTDGLHSVLNAPNTVYDQLLSEYGLLGLSALLFLYMGYFFRYHRRLTFGLPVLLLMGVFFFVDYWFEQLSIVILFELLLFLDLKKATP
jgi:hypothetical protein